MAFLAVALFILVLTFEFLLITWLPYKLRREKIWEKQIALQEMVELEDIMRAWISSSKEKHRNISGEIELVNDSLDDLARYLREYKDILSREQIGDIYSDLKGFESIYINALKTGKSSIRYEKLQSDIFLGKVLENVEAKDNVRTENGNGREENED